MLNHLIRVFTSFIKEEGESKVYFFSAFSTSFIKKSSKLPFISFTFLLSTIIFQLSIMLILSQILSTSAKICVLKNIVVQSFFSEIIKSFTIFLQIGSSQLIGSSKNKSFGWFIIACASPIL
ncbi:MAG: hypothetical protein LBD88_03090 [Candidatus Peribacteria bacterium]|nr:hypothetical protein [Candidatus Peribacteria bacterium]